MSERRFATQSSAEENIAPFALGFKVFSLNCSSRGSYTDGLKCPRENYTRYL